MRRLEYAAHAVRDMREIGRYTRQKWGAAQQQRYRQEIELGLRNLSLNPHLGRLRDDIAPDLRSFRVGVHLALYLIRDDGITVLRVLHPSMNIEQAMHDVYGVQEPRVEYGAISP